SASGSRSARESSWARREAPTRAWECTRKRKPARPPAAHAAAAATVPPPCTPADVDARADRSPARGRGGAFQRSIASLRRAGVHGWTTRACAEQDCAAQCAPPPSSTFRDVYRQAALRRFLVDR